MGRAQDISWQAPPTGRVLQRLHRDFDNGGNVLVESIYDVSGTLVRRRQRDYDVKHRVVAEYGLTTADVKRWDYENGVLQAQTDEVGSVTTFAHDGFARLHSTTVAKPGGVTPPVVTTYTYDARDGLASVTDGNGNGTTYVSDDFGNLLQVTTPNSGTTKYEYTGDGTLLAAESEVARAGLEKLEYQYDGLRRPTAQHRVVHCVPDLTTCGRPPFIVSDTQLVTWGYDVGPHAQGRLSSVSFPGGQRALTYDAAGRLKDETTTLAGLPTPLTLSRTYLPSGALQSLSYPPQQPTVTSAPTVLSFGRGYDEEVSDVTFGGTVLAPLVVHEPFGGGLRLLYRNPANGRNTLIQRDLLGRPFDAQNGVMRSFYDYYPTGDLQTAADFTDVRTRRYGYDDALHRLTSATFIDQATGAAAMAETYAYDSPGNRLLRTRNATKNYISVFDTRPNPGGAVPANDLLREILDPSVAGQCAQPDGGVAASLCEDDDGHGVHECREGDDEGEGRHRRDAGTGTPLPVCQARQVDVRALTAGWERIVEAAEKLLEAAPRLAPDVAQNRVRTILDMMRAWMKAYDISAPALMAVLASTKSGGVDFASTLQAYLARRAAGIPPTSVDHRLLKTLVELAEEAPVRFASTLDPVWSYTYDAAGNATSTTVTLPPLLIPGPAGPVQLAPSVSTTNCYLYDARQRMVQVETLTRVGASQGAGPPCADPARTGLAEYRYDEASRRVYSKVAGVESWELRGPDGELLAEVNSSSEVERAYIYLDGQPLAMQVLNPGRALRPPSSPLGCAAVPAEAAWPLALVLAAVALRRRKSAPSHTAAGALAAVALTTGCGGGGPQPPPPGGSGDPIYYFHNDRLGAPVALTDERGAVVWRAEYRPFGELESEQTDPGHTGTHVEQPLRLPGQYDDALSGLLLAQGPYYNWNRWYEPATGRFLSPEPMLQSPGEVRSRAEGGGQLATYAYASNNPTLNVDETGLLDYPIACPFRGLRRWWVHAPGNTPCDDCADVSASAASL